MTIEIPSRRNAAATPPLVEENPLPEPHDCPVVEDSSRLPAAAAIPRIALLRPALWSSIPAAALLVLLWSSGPAIAPMFVEPASYIEAPLDSVKFDGILYPS